MIDDLTYSYIGTQLSKVTEGHVTEPTYYDAFNFIDGADVREEYVYDANGNLTKNFNKKISKIEYNSLNLPSRLQFSCGNMTEYAYDGAGRKLIVTHTTSRTNLFVPMGSIVPPQSTNVTMTLKSDYCGNMLYENGSLKWILTDDGYITFLGSTPVYHYFLKDHQGNNRVVMDANGNIEQVNHYYPFGGLMGDSNNKMTNQNYPSDYKVLRTQPYKYNGKELDRMHGLDWYDYGARHYDPALGRWMCMDPKAEKYYSVSPYVYCLNNPIKFLDKKGQEPGDFFKNMNDAAIDFGRLFNGVSIRQGVEYGATIFKMKDTNGKVGYSYTLPNTGKGTDVVASPEPFGETRVADIHTHGSYSHGQTHDNEFSGIRIGSEDKLLSQSQRMKSIDIGYDIGQNNVLNIVGYLATPNGTLQKYDPKTGEIIVLNKDMPSDPSDPARVNIINAFQQKTPNIIDFMRYSEKLKNIISNNHF